MHSLPERSAVVPLIAGGPTERMLGRAPENATAPVGADSPQSDCRRWRLQGRTTAADAASYRHTNTIRAIKRHPVDRLDAFGHAV
jgi:hypothetical protein